MVPAVPIVPGAGLHVVEIAKHQKQYNTLPAHISDDGTVLIRWKLSMRERLKLLWTGDLYHKVLTFNHPLQPILLSVDKPNCGP